MNMDDSFIDLINNSNLSDEEKSYLRNLNGRDLRDGTFSLADKQRIERMFLAVDSTLGPEVFDRAAKFVLSSGQATADLQAYAGQGQPLNSDNNSVLRGLHDAALFSTNEFIQAAGAIAQNDMGRWLPTQATIVEGPRNEFGLMDPKYYKNGERRIPLTAGPGGSFIGPLIRSHSSNSPEYDFGIHSLVNPYFRQMSGGTASLSFGGKSLRTQQSFTFFVDNNPINDSLSNYHTAPSGIGSFGNLMFTPGANPQVSGNKLTVRVAAGTLLTQPGATGAVSGHYALFMDGLGYTSENQRQIRELAYSIAPSPTSNTDPISWSEMSKAAYFPRPGTQWPLDTTEGRQDFTRFLTYMSQHKDTTQATVVSNLRKYNINPASWEVTAIAIQSMGDPMTRRAAELILAEGIRIRKIEAERVRMELRNAVRTAFLREEMAARETVQRARVQAEEARRRAEESRRQQASERQRQQLMQTIYGYDPKPFVPIHQRQPAALSRRGPR